MRLALDQLPPRLRYMAFGKERYPRVSAIAAKTCLILQIGICFLGFA
jgi:hypothetical protein